TDIYSVDLRGTATAIVAKSVQSVTSVGVQLADTRLAGQTAYVSGLTPTNLTLNGATAPAVTQAATRQATLGGYVEEQLGFNDRLFLVGAVRVDAASGFGRTYSVATYPKASISWLALAGGATTLRLRGAFGVSGVQPTNGASQLAYTYTSVYLGGTTQS